MPVTRERLDSVARALNTMLMLCGMLVSLVDDMTAPEPEKETPDVADTQAPE